MRISTSPRRVLAATFLTLGLVAAVPYLALAIGAQPLERDGALPQPLGLPGAEQVLVSGDAAFVYGRDAGAVAAYAWTPGGPNLTPLQVHRDGEGGVVGIGESEEMAFSPGDTHLYVAGANSVAVFARDAGSGLLTFVEAQVDGAGGVSGLSDPREVAVSADGAHVYVTSVGNVVVFSRNPTTGALTFVEAEVLPLSSAGVDVVVSPDGGHVYVSAASLSSGRVVVYTRNPGTGELSYASENGTPNPRELVISPDSAHLYVGRSLSSQHYTRDLVTGALTLVGTLGGGGIDRHFLSADGDTYLVLDGGDLLTYTRDLGTGAVTFVASTDLGTQGHRPAALTTDETTLFTSGHLGVGVHTLNHPALTATEIGFHRVPGGNAVIEHAVVSPDGEHLYAAMDGALFIYDRDPSDGSASLSEEYIEGFNGMTGVALVNDLAVSEDGAFLYVAGAEGSSVTPASRITVLSRDAGTGALAFVESEIASASVLALVGEHLYTACPVNSLCLFDRDLVTGELSFVDFEATYVSSPRWLTVTPDGGSVYVPGDVDGQAGKDLATTIHGYSRNPATGELTEVLTFEVPNVTYGGVASPTSTEIYIASRFDAIDNLKSNHQLHTYARDTGTGALTKIDEDQSGKHGVQFGEPLDLIMSSDGSHVYGVLFGDLPHSPSGLASFVLDPFSGHASFVEVVEGLRSPVAVSASDTNLYAASFSGATMERLSLGFQCSETPLAGCRTPVKATLQVIDDAAKDKSDRIKFTWRGDTELTHAEVDPVGKDYGVCLYDQSGGPGTLLVGALVPADQTCGNAGKPCWTDKIKKVIYKDPNKTPEGASLLILQPHETKPQVKAKLQGVDLGWRVATALPPSLPVLVQVQGQTGPCWEASFSAALKNDGRQFKSVFIQ